jgi:hypothetical protein
MISYHVTRYPTGNSRSNPAARNRLLKTDFDEPSISREAATYNSPAAAHRRQPKRSSSGRRARTTPCGRESHGNGSVLRPRKGIIARWAETRELLRLPVRVERPRDVFNPSVLSERGVRGRRISSNAIPANGLFAPTSNRSEDAECNAPPSGVLVARQLLRPLFLQQFKFPAQMARGRNRLNMTRHRLLLSLKAPIKDAN